MGPDHSEQMLEPTMWMSTPTLQDSTSHAESSPQVSGLRSDCIDAFIRIIERLKLVLCITPDLHAPFQRVNGGGVRQRDSGRIQAVRDAQVRRMPVPVIYMSKCCSLYLIAILALKSPVLHLCAALAKDAVRRSHRTVHGTV